MNPSVLANSLLDPIRAFVALTDRQPFHWQRRLLEEWLLRGKIPDAVDMPTGLGKTMVMALWLVARCCGAHLPRRLVYVVDRRAVVDQATEEAEKLRASLERDAKHLKEPLGLGPRSLPISTLRGAYVDNREWLDDPATPAIVIGTVDMIGSRLLFEGYGVSRKMRPYQAGLLGTDALIVLDEAHLVPPFEHLLRGIERGMRAIDVNDALGPMEEADRALLPNFAFLPLSATHRDGRKEENGRAPFRLEEADWKTDNDAITRLEAKKRLRLEPFREKEQDKQLAEAAWALAMYHGKVSRVVVFCDRRDGRDDGAGPSAKGVKSQIEKLAAQDNKATRTTTKIHPVELLVGARRVHERQSVAKRLSALGFIGEKKPLGMPAFLVATSAGEVGVDIDADHMVCDLVAWERMVQRLGRVNRRGEGDAEIKVFWRKPLMEDANAPTKTETNALVAFGSKAVIEKLPQNDRDFNASPGALRRLADRGQSDAALTALIDAATTPEPLRPALNRPLVEAWSMTTLETHTGRPEVAPWLRGWVLEPPQTTIIWRAHLPVRVEAGVHTLLPAKTEIEDFFEAAPPHESEKLETETYRVATWLQERASALISGRGKAPAEGGQIAEAEDGVAGAADDIDGEEPTNDVDIEESTSKISVEPTKQNAPPLPRLQRDQIVAMILSSSGAYAGRFTAGELARERKGKEKDKFFYQLIGRTLVVDGRFGGLEDGVLDVDSDDLPETADASDAWSRQAQFRVRRVAEAREDREDGWRFEDSFVLRRNDEGDPLELLVVEHFRDVAQMEDARSISNPQELSTHQQWARSEAFRMANAIGLLNAAATALAVGAGLHDEGKRALRWQRAFKAQRDAFIFRLVGPLAKTRGPIDQALLDGYRHEFGSLPYLEASAEFKALPDDWRDLVLHLVAAHHGRARPVIETRGCEDGPPSLLEGRARAVALRFARLQKRWGPWGLAWWEALLRAADQQASRDNDTAAEAIASSLETV
jgi:CRISPR-associated endonuclease/helicase Cas3